MSKDHGLLPRKGLSPQRSAAHLREAMAKQFQEGITLNPNFVLTCSDDTLANYELARLAQFSDLRSEMQVLIDRMVDTLSQAAVVAWLRTIDRQELTRQLLQSPDASIDEILARAREEIRNQGRSQEETKEAGPMPSPWGVRPQLPPAVARARTSARSLNWSNENIAKGKCQSCTEPLDPNSVRYCTKHLAARREYREKKGIQTGTQGRQPGTLANLAIHREKRKRALLLKLGVKPDHAAVSFNAAVEALGKIMPRSEAEAMTCAELLMQVGISTTTGREALAETTEAGAIER